MAFKLDKRAKEKIMIYGEEFEISFPSVKTMMHFMEMKKEDGFDEANATLELIASLGIARDFLEAMEPGDFAELAKYICEPKKK